MKVFVDFHCAAFLGRDNVIYESTTHVFEKRDYHISAQKHNSLETLSMDFADWTRSRLL